MAKFVIDISQHQGVINWTAAKPNIDGAILRCGFGDNIASQDDMQWSRNLSECERLGIPRGVYLYSYASSDAQAQSELQHILRLIKGHKFQLPIYLDCEEGYTAGYAQRACQIICEGVKAAGFTPGVYANTSWWNTYLKGVSSYTRWVAQYNNVCTYQGQYDIWQYSSDGQVPGVPGRVDVNHCYKEFGQLIWKNEQTEKIDTGGREIMYAIIKEKGSAKHYFFDGFDMHGLGTSGELAALQEIYRGNNGKNMPDFEYEKEKIENIKVMLKRTVK